MIIWLILHSFHSDYHLLMSLLFFARLCDGELSTANHALDVLNRDPAACLTSTALRWSNCWLALDLSDWWAFHCQPARTSAALDHARRCSWLYLVSRWTFNSLNFSLLVHFDVRVRFLHHFFSPNRANLCVWFSPMSLPPAKCHCVEPNRKLDIYKWK